MNCYSIGMRSFGTQKAFRQKETHGQKSTWKDNSFWRGTYVFLHTLQCSADMSPALTVALRRSPSSEHAKLTMATSHHKARAAPLAPFNLKLSDNLNQGIARNVFSPWQRTRKIMGVLGEGLISLFCFISVIKWIIQTCIVAVDCLGQLYLLSLFECLPCG